MVEHDIRERATALASAAQAAIERGKRDQAIALWHGTFDIEPHEAHYAIEATNGLIRLGEPLLALEMCTRWIARNPDNAIVRVQRGIIYLNECGDRESAIECFVEALEFDPDNCDAHSALAQIYLFAGRPELMRFHAKQALIRADEKSALHLRGRFLSDYAGVIERAGALLAQTPDDVDIWLMLGKALYMQSRYLEALDAFSRAEEIAPHRVDAFGPLGDVLILLGREREGWRKLEGVSSDEYVLALDPDIAPYLSKWWRGQSLQGKRILVAYHAGVGDNLMLARYASRLTAAGASVHFVCRPELHRLFRDLDGAQSVASGWRPDELANYDYWVFDYLLPAYMHETAAAISDSRRGYIEAPADARARWDSFMQPYAGKLKVGLCWYSGPHNFSGIDRFVPARALKPLSEIEGIEWFVLQKNQANASLTRQSGIRAHDVSSQWTDFADTAGFIDHLDLVISVDSSPLHLAGALGKPTWGILPSAPEWRWGLQGERTEWYPTVRLYRQKKLHDWEPVIGRIAHDLRELVGERGASV